MIDFFSDGEGQEICRNIKKKFRFFRAVLHTCVLKVVGTNRLLQFTHNAAKISSWPFAETFG